VIVGLVLGLTFAGDRPLDLADAARRTRQELDGAAGLLEVARIEYRESVADGQVVSEPEYRASQAAVARSRARYDAVAEVVATLDAGTASGVDRGYDELVTLMAEPADPDRVDAAATALETALRGEPGADDARPTEG
jgi:hypothetical protein